MRPGEASIRYQQHMEKCIPFWAGRFTRVVKYAKVPELDHPPFPFSAFPSLSPAATQEPYAVATDHLLTGHLGCSPTVYFYSLCSKSWHQHCLVRWENAVDSIFSSRLAVQFISRSQVPPLKPTPCPREQPGKLFWPNSTGSCLAASEVDPICLQWNVTSHLQHN